MTRITVPLSDVEHEVLTKMAIADLRDPRAVIRWLLREEAKRQGLWLPDLDTDAKVDNA
jgi:hypothetical protein